MFDVVVCVGLGQEERVFLSSAQSTRRPRCQYYPCIGPAPMHPLGQRKSVSCPGRVQGGKQDIDRNIIQKPESLSCN